RLAAIDDIPIGTAQTVGYPTEQDPCILIRTGERAFVAYSPKCTHLSCAVITQVADDVIRSPCHEGLFYLATGRPLAGPPTRPLACVIIELRGNEMFATGVEARTV